MIDKVTRSVDQNFWLNGLDIVLNEPKNQNLVKYQKFSRQLMR